MTRLGLFFSVPFVIISLLLINKYDRNLPDQSLVSCHKHTHRAATQTSSCQKAFIHPTHILMITVFVDNYNPISQDFYDSVLNSIQFHQLTCPCGHSACLTIHGYYTRRVKNPEGDVLLRICRVYCSCCHHTHAVLLSSMVPYSQISLAGHMEILSAHENGIFPDSLMERNPSIDESNCRYIIRRFLQYWKQRLLSERILLSQDNLVPQCFSHFFKQFMQIRCAPNILFCGSHTA